jgi:hypothetical protein
MFREITRLKELNQNNQNESTEVIAGLSLELGSFN